MTTPTELLRQAMEAIEELQYSNSTSIAQRKGSEAIHAIHTHLASGEVQEPVAQPVIAPGSPDALARIIAGALVDFMGKLTSQPEVCTFSSAHDASPAVDQLQQFAKLRGLFLDEANVKNWTAALKVATPQSVIAPSQESDKPRVNAASFKWLNPSHIRLIAGEVTTSEMRCILAVVKAFMLEVAPRKWVGLTKEEAADCWSIEAVRTWHALESKLKEKNS